MTPADPHPITELLVGLRAGRPGAEERLLDVVYAELRKLAAAQMRRQSAAHTLQPTALVHEAWLRLLGEGAGDWTERGHFYAAAARAMRSILVDHARARLAEKRGGGAARLSLDEGFPARTDPLLEVLAVHEALEQLAAESERKARIVELRYFCGLTLEETSEALGVSIPTVHREWEHARLWLAKRIRS